MYLESILRVYNLFEANVYNIKEKLDDVSMVDYLKQYAKNVPGAELQAIFIKKLTTLLVNDERWHFAIRQLPAGAPEWAQKAMSAQQLVAFKPNPELNDALQHITHYLSAAVDDVEKSPSPDQKVFAQRELAAFPKAENLDVIKKHSDEYFARGSRKAGRDTTGLKQIFDAGDGFIWYTLEEEDAFRREGKALQNCIGTIYTKARCAKDKTAIAVLKNPSNESVVAMRVHVPTRTMYEVKGKNNRPPVDKYMTPTIKLIKNMKLKIDDMAIHDLQEAGYYYDEATGELMSKAEAIKKLVTTEPMGKVGPYTLTKSTVRNQELWGELYGSIVSDYGGYWGSSDRSPLKKYQIYELRDTSNNPIATAIVQRTSQKLEGLVGYHQQQAASAASAVREAQENKPPLPPTRLLVSELMKRGLVTSMEKNLERQFLWKEKLSWSEKEKRLTELPKEEITTDKEHTTWRRFKDPALVQQLFKSLKGENAYYEKSGLENYKVENISEIFMSSDTAQVPGDEGDEAETTAIILKTTNGALLPIRVHAVAAGALTSGFGFKATSMYDQGAERDNRVVQSLIALANREHGRLPKSFRLSHGVMRSGDTYQQFEPKFVAVPGKVPASKLDISQLAPADRLAAITYTASNPTFTTIQPQHGRADVLGVIRAIKDKDDQWLDTQPWKKGQLENAYQKVFGEAVPDTLYLVDITFGAKQAAKVLLIAQGDKVLRIDRTTASSRWQKWTDYDTVAAQLNTFADEHKLTYAPDALVEWQAKTLRAGEHSSELRIIDGKVSTAAVAKTKEIERLRQKGRYQMEGTDELAFADGTKLVRMDPDDQAKWVREKMGGEGGRAEAWKVTKDGRTKAIITVDRGSLVSMYGQGYDKSGFPSSRGLVFDMLPYVKKAAETFGWTVSKSRLMTIEPDGKLHEELRGYDRSARRREYLRTTNKFLQGLGLVSVNNISQYRKNIEITEKGEETLKKLNKGEAVSVLGLYTGADLPKGFVAPKRREIVKAPRAAGTGKYKVSLAAPREGTKAEQALAKFRAMAKKNKTLPTRAEFMAVLMLPPFSMSKLGAQTYFYTTKAKYGALGESYSAQARTELREDALLRSFRLFLVS